LQYRQAAGAIAEVLKRQSLSVEVGRFGQPFFGAHDGLVYTVVETVRSGLRGTNWRGTSPPGFAFLYLEAIRRQAMAPQHIHDLPRHEEPRQLMLGLIDELPQERRGTRELMMWGWLGLAIVLFFVLVWVTAPNGPPP
jgi:hypothetical protein